MSVTKEMIVEVSINILNSDGEESLSMRTIAQGLNIKAAALYWHFKGKLELYGAIAEHLCSQITMPDESFDPQEYLLTVQREYRMALLSVRDSVVIFENSIPNTPVRIGIIRRIADKLLQMGVVKENIMTISNMLNNYVLSFTADEMRFKNSPPELKKTFTEMLDPEDKFIFINDRDFDEQFEYGLQVLFMGLKALDDLG
ncbi:MAG: TetR family transcriptional regulator [Clostridiales bacterium]|jgi:AcrR family transcriptional regulator|nr:TetR family transcriptional regulator [Clostridiales bacterium]